MKKTVRFHSGKAVLHTALLIMLCFPLSLAGCAAQDEGSVPGQDTVLGTPAVTEPVETVPVQQNGRLTIADGGKGLFTVLRAENASKREISAARSICEAVKAVCGVSLDFGTDLLGVSETVDPAALEILVGGVDREETRALSDGLPAQCFAIRTTDSKVIIAAADEIALEAGAAYFCEHYLSEKAAEVSDGRLVLTTEIDYVSEPVEYLAGFLPTADTFSAECTKLYSIAAPAEGMTTPQGGCTDGTYMYQLFIRRDWDNDEKNNIDRIVKTELATGKVVGVSGDLSLNHGNDITYNPQQNVLLVVHNNPYRNKVSLINPDTLELIETKTLKFQIYSIDYNATHDRYVVGLSGGQTFRFLDADLQMIELKGVYPPTQRTKDCITQGVACDDDFIYFVLYRPNVITVYDWSGKFVTLIELDVGDVEPENISVVGNCLYVNTTGGGATVWRVIPVEKKAE